MRKSRRQGRGCATGLSAAALAMVLFAAGPASSAAGGRERRIASDRILITVREEAVVRALGTSRPTAAQLVARLGLPRGARIEESKFVRWAKEQDRRRRRAARPDPAVDLSRPLRLLLPPGMTPDQAVARMRSHAWVETAGVVGMGSAGAIPADPDYSSQWHLGGSIPAGRIRAPEAWDLTTGSTSIVVAVLDSGCNTNLSEFAGRTVPGYDMVNVDADPADDYGHGTKMAGVLCANANNGARGAGVDWNCRLMPVKVLNAVGDGYYDDWADAIDWAVSNGAKVINLSAGGFWPDDSPSPFYLSNAINRAVSNGAVLVTITHNDGMAELRYPGSHPLAIAVGAIDITGQRLGFSNYGANIALMAPGTNIYTVGTNGLSAVGAGTSYAAPQVAGAASLILARRPDLSPGQVRSLLCAGADDRVSGDVNDLPGYDLYYGWGQLNVYNSLLLARTAVATVAPTNASDLALGWACPPNASNRLPYRVAFAPAVTGAWTTASNIAYGTTNAIWVDTNTASGPRFYRIDVPAF